MKRGFTLIELLVVISIIGTLSSVVISSLNTSRAKSRDAVRVEQVQEIVKAAGTYYTDVGDYLFPINPNRTICLGKVDGETCWGGLIPGNTRMQNILVPTYLPSIPSDPQTDRGVGDAYLFAAIHAIKYSDHTPLAGYFIVYEPDAGGAAPTTCPIGDLASCPVTNNACPIPVGTYFCAVSTM